LNLFDEVGGLGRPMMSCSSLYILALELE